ncbi:hypothetical protein SI65_07630 [Aspergillus cristatus]|uniref:Tyrosine specific protein phosphatases domain-containing protein n=1 Tax=Aspergillus cristatus TaxID=573508 RepID=A0A1E3B8V1_ASPCR|nr:hypothetical protein SI65_07630 [Aspergillus cristatus]
MIAGLSNFRDVGGLPTRAGTVRRNRLFRSAQPGQITPGGTESLRQLGITTIFDLRSTVEISNYDFMQVKDINGIQRVSVPIFTNSDTSQQILKRRNYALGQPGFKQEYREILKNGGSAFTQILKHIRDHPSDACLIHCSLGRDRTGVLIALLLALVGVDDETILADYERSEEGLAGWRPKLEKILVADDPWLGEDPDALNNMLSARGSNLRGTLEWMRTEYGGPEGYIKEVCGLTEGDLQLIKAHLVDGDE